jgi:capsular polysaccharide biosynthesis protein
MVDDFTEVVKSGAFAADVSRRLADKGVVVPAGAIQGSAATGKQHRILTLTITWPNRDQTLAIAQAAIAALQEDSPKYFPQLGDQPAIAKPLDEPVVGVVPPSLRERLDLPIRLALALVAGIALAFLLDYLDDTVRDAREVEAIGLHVLGEIPPLRGWLIPWRRRLP